MNQILSRLDLIANARSLHHGDTLMTDELGDAAKPYYLLILLHCHRHRHTHTHIYNFPRNVIDSIVNRVFNRAGLASDFENFVTVMTRRKYRRS